MNIHSKIDLHKHDELHYELGRALWRIQSFEEILAKLICIMPLKLSSKENEKSFDERHEFLSTRTLGILVGYLQSKTDDETLLNFFKIDMKQYVAERNWLVHHSWKECSNVIYLGFDQQFKQTITRIKAITDQSSELNKRANSVSDQIMILRGYDLRDIDKAHAEQYYNNTTPPEPH